jgi:hypothetical protein
MLGGNAAAGISDGEDRLFGFNAGAEGNATAGRSVVESVGERFRMSCAIRPDSARQGAGVSSQMIVI